MHKEGLEKRVIEILRQAKPAKAKRQVRPIFLILLILALTAPLAISQVSQEPIQIDVRVYKVPRYQSQVQPAVIKIPQGSAYFENHQSHVGCTTLKTVRHIQSTENGSKKI